VADPVIQATGRSEFEDGLGSGVVFSLAAIPKPVFRYSGLYKNRQKWALLTKIITF
jgi:hypothetical protein